MYDLIYGDKKAEELVRQKFPSAKIEDASDEVHTDRFSIQTDGDEIPDEYIEFMLKTGLYRLSLNIGLACTGMDKQLASRVVKIANKLKKKEEEINA